MKSLKILQVEITVLEENEENQILPETRNKIKLSKEARYLKGTVYVIINV